MVVQIDLVMLGAVGRILGHVFQGQSGWLGILVLALVATVGALKLLLPLQEVIVMLAFLLGRVE